MKKVPLFEIGAKVVRLFDKSYGEVVNQFGDGNGGFRYYVRCAGHLWSVPEDGLRLVKTREKTVSSSE